MGNLLNARLRDPLRNYQFAVFLGAPKDPKLAVAGVQKVSGLSFSVAPFEVWEGGNNLHRYANPDRVTWDPITLEQGLALGDDLEVWAEAVRYFAMTGTKKGGVAIKRDLTILLWDPVDRGVAGGPNLPRPVILPDGRAAAEPVLDEPGHLTARRYDIKNAWISKYTAMPRLDAIANEVALLSVELVHEGWTVSFYDSTKDIGAGAPTAPIP